MGKSKQNLQKQNDYANASATVRVPSTQHRLCSSGVEHIAYCQMRGSHGAVIMKTHFMQRDAL